MIASCTSGQRRSVQVSSSAPASAADERRDLHRGALRLPAEAVGEDHAEPGDLRHREVDEHDAALEHLHAERHVRRGHEQAGDERRPQDAEARRRRASFQPPRAAARSCRRTSRTDPSPCRVPPTVNGSITAGNAGALRQELRRLRDRCTASRRSPSPASRFICSTSSARCEVRRRNAGLRLEAADLAHAEPVDEVRQVLVVHDDAARP